MKFTQAQILVMISFCQTYKISSEKGALYPLYIKRSDACIQGYCYAIFRKIV